MSAAVYRPHLDGLRAVAVYLVVLFHAGSDRFLGGFVGVDIFFVLSGFLVTQLLLRDITRRGAIRLGRFYARRFRRLLPAAFVALVVTAAVFPAISSPVEVLDSIGSFKAAFLYSTNWYFIHQSADYFGADVTANPVFQFWSLAVEEQFYLVWPLALGGVFALTRRLELGQQMRVIRVAVAVGALASLVWALSLRNSDPNRAYFGTDARAYELLAGALIALVPAFVAWAKRFRSSMRIAATLSVVSLLVLATAWVHLDAIERGAAVTITTCVLLVTIEAADGGTVKRVLSSTSVVYLGKISYGTYLWHWLVILVAASAFHLSTIATIGIAFLVATALAALSFELLERPVRVSGLLDRHRRIVVASGLAISVVSALVLIPAIIDPAGARAPVAQGATTAGFTPVPAGLDWRNAKSGAFRGGFPNCYRAPAAACTVVRGTGRHLLLMGDSHAQMMVPTFTEIARREHLTLSLAVKGACPWQRDLFVPAIRVAGKTIRPEGCKAEKEDLYARVIQELHPDVIVVMQYPYETPNQLVHFLGPDGRPLEYGTPAYARWLETTTTASVAALRAGGRDVLIMEPIQIAPFDPLACLSRAKVLEECRYVGSLVPDSLERLYRRLATRDDRVWSADLDRLVCPYLPICDPIVDGQIVKFDVSHLTEKFAKSLVAQVNDYLKRIGLIPR